MSFAALFALYLESLQSPTFETPKGAKRELKIVFAGYSYGSMIASQIPPLERCSSFFTGVMNKDGELRFKAQAEQLKMEYLELDGELYKTVRKEPSDQAHQRPSDSSITTHYLLVSPIVPPLIWAVAVRAGNPFNESSGAARNHLSSQRSMALFGDKDSFASKEKLQQWAEGIQSVESSLFEFKEIKGAGHFWIEDGTRDKLRESIGEWLKGRTSE